MPTLYHSSHSLPKPRALLFDWDQTLVDTRSIIVRATTATFTGMGKEKVDLSNISHTGGQSMSDFFQKSFQDRWEEAGELYRQEYRTHRFSHLRVMPGSTELLAALCAHVPDLYLGVVSNKLGSLLRDEVMHFGWDAYFKAVVGSRDAPKDKPSADPVFHALLGSDLTPGPDIWFIGDSMTDMECAKNSGCTAILYDPDDVADSLAQQYQPAYHVRSHDTLSAILIH